MRLSITHSTRYEFAKSPQQSTSQIRLQPLSSDSQEILDWSIDISGAVEQVGYVDEHQNDVRLITTEPETDHIEIACRGQVETFNTNGVMGQHTGFAPLWLYLSQTHLTQPGRAVSKILSGLNRTNDTLSDLHRLSEHILESVQYTTDTTDAGTTAESAAQNGAGVCQDHAHIFISCARKLGIPARYVSGYIMLLDRVDQSAGHAWAEAWVQNLGWVGFDISNSVSPDERHLKVSVGRDYSEAAPLNGIRRGGKLENLIVSVQVQQ